MKKEHLSLALSHGLGDAHLYLRDHGDSDPQVAENLLKACLYNTIYDNQCEKPRGAWLLSLIDLSINPHY